MARFAMRTAFLYAVLMTLAVPLLAHGDASGGKGRTPAADEKPPATTRPSGDGSVTRRIRTAPMQSEGVRAPRLGVPVSADPLSRQDPTTSAVFPTEFGSTEYGFEMPDMNEPFRDIEADQMRQGLETNKLELEGNVRLRLGDMLFQSDTFSYEQELGEIGATGSVRIEQMNSTLEADSIQYVLATADSIPAPSVLEPAYTPEQIEEQRLRLGRVKASGLHVIEPTREIIADEFEYDLMTDSGVILKARGKAGIYYFFAEKLIVTGPDSFEAEDVWLSTCECDVNNTDEFPPAYRIRLKNMTIRDGKFIKGTRARLQLRNASTPIFLPVWRGEDDSAPWTIDFDTGSRAEIGTFLNVGQRFRLNDDVQLGPRLYATQDQGIGFGGDLSYDFMETPSSRLYRTKGDFSALYTTKDRGYAHWYHRYQPSEDLVAKMQLEHWGDSDFYKDFYYDQYRNRTTPRSFANVTYRKDNYIATATARVNTHGWVRETERLPEASFHVPERAIADRLYLTFDTVAGYHNREPTGVHGGRATAVARLSYDLEFGERLSLTPFLEASGAYYTDTVYGGDSDDWGSVIAGITAQTRLQRDYGGVRGFSAFKHIIMPSLTLSHRPDVSLDERDIPFYDTWDLVAGRTRIETKLDNILLGRDAETGDVWQVGRLTLYQGNDLDSENRQSDDYEIELDIRPRPWWGIQMVGERHLTSDEIDLDDPFAIETFIADRYERITGSPFSDLDFYDFNSQFGDYDRVLAQFYYDSTQVGGRFDSRLGFSYTETRGRVFNREILYGVGYRLSDQWSVAMEHRYDLEFNDLRTQTYEVRRIWDCWETAIRFRDRESGFDVNFEISLTAIPGTKLKI